MIELLSQRDDGVLLRARLLLDLLLEALCQLRKGILHLLDPDKVLQVQAFLDLLDQRCLLGTR